MKKIIVCALIAFAVLATLTACGNPKETGGQTPENQTRSGGEENTAELSSEITPDLPDVNMDGKTFNFLTCNWPGEAVWTMADITVEELTGETLNDAKYNRNVSVETKYNCKITETNINSPGDAVTQLTKAVKAQDATYDAFLARMQNYQNLGATGLVIDLNELEYADFSKPWWDHKSVGGLSIANKLFAVCGDITTMDKAATSAIVFNKQLLADNGLEDPYTLVRNGEWTVDKFMSLSKQISEDINGDGKMDKEDRYGLLYQRDTVLSFFSGSGEMIGRKDENDIPYITLTQETALNKMIYILESLYNKDSCFNVMFLSGDFNVGMDAMFQNNQSLFMWIRMVNIVSLRTMPTDFGILPIPKMDLAQKEYSSDVNSWTGVCLTIPATVTDMANTGIFLEAYAAESSKTVQPAYYDVLLNGIIARDDESLDMLDLIFKNRTYDIGAIGTYGGLQDILYMPMTYDLNVASYVEKRLERAEKDIDNLLAKIDRLN